MELAFYGDDFTGSTDVLESLSLRGKKTVLWLHIPEPSQLEAFENYDCVGLAGVSRSKDTEWMKEHLPAAFKFLKSMDPNYIQYKVCSTFDSSIEKGNIATATKIGCGIIEPHWTSVVVGTPKIKRYVCFGELFADYKGSTYRIDRHPVMSCHPATPMKESNIVKHMHNLGCERCESINLSMYANSEDERYLSRYINDDKVVVFDSYDEATLSRAGELIRTFSQKGIHFSVSSSGFIDAVYSSLPTNEDKMVKPKSKILALSGSCSPITGSQIKHAIEKGFYPIKLDISRLIEQEKCAKYLSEVVEHCLQLVADDLSPIVYSALGPNDSSLAMVKKLKFAKLDQVLGQFLGQIATEVAKAGVIERLAVAGGDTSGYCVQSLDIDALTFIAPFCPGVPLCRAHAKNPQIDGLEVALKGGQMGDDNFFDKLRLGGE